MNIAILIPCYNEEQTIKKVVQDFRHELPGAQIFVYDNNSTDQTSYIAEQSGAIVRKETRQGKGNVVRAMFSDIDADVYVMVDGDDTYPASAVHQMIEPIIRGEADMVVGDRLSNGTYQQENKRNFHEFGNVLVRGLIRVLYKSDIHDIMTGYRAFHPHFVKAMPVMSTGFQVETELTIHALDKRFRIQEIPIDYRDRPPGSESKLNTLKDGYKVLQTIFSLCKDYRPLLFFFIWASIFFALACVVGCPVITEFVQKQYITRLPSAVLAVGLVVLSSISLACGFILDTVASTYRKQYELQLQKIRSPRSDN